MEACMSSMFGNNPVELSPGLKQLISEHPPLLTKIDGLLERCNKVENGENVAENFNQLRSAVQEFATKLDFHSVREEDILFAMMAVYIGRDGGPIAVMEYEHEQAKNLINTFLENTENGYNSFIEEKVLQNIALIKQASHTLRDHFMKEENVLYPMAERMLSEEEKTELLEKI